MKKYLSFAGLILCATLILGISTGRIYARLTGTDPGTDIFCVGPSGTEICVDVSGNLVPTTTNIGSLGTSSLKFKDMFLAGTASIAGATTQTGALTLSAKLVPWSRTKAQFTALTPAAAGEVYFCSDCTEKLLCVSTGTALSDFQRVDSATIGCGTGE